MTAGAARVRRGVVAILAGLLVLASAAPVSAQYFGRNKVQYEEFDFRILHTDHFDIHYYPEEEQPVRDAARMGERWYTRLSRIFNHEFSDVKPVILYANHPDFQQTNTIGGELGEGTGGFTESVKNRVVLPLTGVYAQNDHVLGHELVHAFQYDIAQEMAAMNQQGLGQLPLWLIEGMAEYLSVGREDPHTAMWLRDAAVRGDLPTFRQLTMDPRFFPYRYGQALWAYIGGRWGDRAVTDLYKSSLRDGWSMSVRRVLRVSDEELNDAWMTSIRSAYLPLLQGKERPEEVATKVLAEDIDAGRLNVGPSLSPDGSRVAYFTERDLFEISLYVADARTGENIMKVADSQTDQHFDALSFLSSAGAWSPDGQRMAFTAFARGDEELVVIDLDGTDVEHRIRIQGVGAVTTPAWSPDGRTIAVSGNSGGVSDLYLVDVESGAVTQLTDDRYADVQPAWSPDGTKLAFVTDRAGTSFDNLTYGNMQLALLDVRTREIEMLDLFGGGKHIDPHFGPEGRWLYFISDADGFTDAYRVEVATGTIERITRLGTGVSGVTAMSPALTVAAETGDVMFSVFSEGDYTVYRMDADQVAARSEPVFMRYAGVQAAGVLPPVEAASRGIVASYLEDPYRGLPEDDFPVDDYSPGLALDYIGVPQGIGVGVSQYGTAIYGAVATYWSDMLGNRQVVAAVQANGGVKDIGGQMVYQNQRGQLNWGVLAGHIPLRLGFIRYEEATLDGIQTIVEDFQILRIYQTRVAGLLELPVSKTRRWEMSLGAQRFGFGLEALRTYYAGGFQPIAQERVDLDPASLDPSFGEAYYMGTASLAYVGDWAYNGFAAPVRGGRFRFEVSPLFGDLNVVELTADYRRYLNKYPFTLALRAFHFGRYGPDAEGTIFTRQTFLGYETLVRGYAYESFTTADCFTGSSQDCPAFERLWGSRLGVLNAEIRVPLLGFEQYGLINLPLFPTDLNLFVDAGLAWTSGTPCEEGSTTAVTEWGSENCAPVFEWDAPDARTPVVSTGVSARVNLLGFAVLETYYAYPFQRPNKGWHWGFVLAPGW
ncbi:MAG: peptidase S9 [Candidatus Longimicrobiales bacterium M2_2A_002]